MLEVKNITKEYRPKKGQPVVALDNVSIKFPEKGMVFILGKSGSGKSTLLNLLGGLDKYDSGEIIIKGKSSKNFSQSEFDSYRNTYLGFIFQEYNILNEFNVAQNIALALQLQGLKATNEAVNEILDQVDLTGYGPRKPSELSGGQKQRVAIARALVKNPEIIMADEPTGALDSNTGLQVFDTLKKLSQSKLVIVITHDRDFAEMYGDRVIELKDGKIISDIEKYSAEAKIVSEGITVTDDKIISIKKGYVLTNKDIKMINDYIAEHDALLSIDDKSNKDLKRFARIGDDGSKESFKDTDESKITYSDASKFKLIKSRLPFKNSLKIGASSLKNKPVRLVFTILLSMVAFTLFGLADTMAAYNKHTATYRSIIESGQKSAVMQISKNDEEVEGSFFGGYANTGYRFTEEEVAALNQKTGINFRPVYCLDTPSISSSILGYRNGQYYIGDYVGYLDVDETDISDLGFAYLGTLPRNDTEVAISKYMYSFYTQYGYKDADDETKNIKSDAIKSENDFLNAHPKIKYDEDKYLTITAIIDTQLDDEKYKSLKEGEDFAVTDFFLYNELSSTVQYGYHGLLFTHKGFVNSMIAANKVTGTGIDLSKYGYGSYYYNFYNYTPDGFGYSLYGSGTKLYTLDEAKAKYTVKFFDGTKTALAENEIMIDMYNLVNMYHSFYLDRYHGEDTDALYNLYCEIQNFRYDTEATEEEYADALAAFFEEYNKASVQADIAEMFANTFECSMSLSAGRTKYYDGKIVGFFYDTQKPTPTTDYYSSYDNGYVVLPQADIDYAKRVLEGDYGFVVAPAPSNDGWKTLINLTYAKPENGVKYILQSATMETISTLNDLIETLSKVFLYIGLGFAVFSALMLTNFISTSIVYKKREIGILRAVGARGADVYGIFANESLIIALINFALSVIATVATVIAISMSFKSEYHLSISILNFGFRQVGLMLAVSVGVALIASFLPTFRISRQKPVDAIKK